MTGPDRLDELLAGDAPRDDEERALVAFVAGLRDAQPEASDRLRGRVAATAARAERPEGRRWAGRGRVPRAAWAGVALAGAAALAIAVPLLRDGGSSGPVTPGDANAPAGAEAAVPSAAAPSPDARAPGRAPASVMAPAPAAPPAPARAAATVRIVTPPDRAAAAATVAAVVRGVRARGGAVTGGAGRAVPVAGGSRYVLRAVLPAGEAVPTAADLSGTGGASGTDAWAARLGRAVTAGDAGDAGAVRAAEVRLVGRDARRAAAIGGQGTPVRVVIRVPG